jgi:hypothetical protein
MSSVELVNSIRIFNWKRTLERPHPRVHRIIPRTGSARVWAGADPGRTQWALPYPHVV